MTVRCPHCSTRYELPERLMGAAGAQVRCPSCKGVFAVTPAGEVREGSKPTPSTPSAAPAVAEHRGAAEARTASHAAAGSAAARSPAAAPPPPPETVARELVNALAARAGEGPRVAFGRGRLFSEWGPALMDLYGEYRRRVGDGASGSPLRAALRERWGIDLPEGDPRGLAG